VVKDASIGEVRFMDAEEELKRAKHDCLLWVKGFHNIQRSTFFMEKFAEKGTCRDQSIKEALFQAAIISYAKPFITTETTKGKVQLPTKPLQNTPLFEVNVHKHMVDLTQADCTRRFDCDRAKICMGVAGGQLKSQRVYHPISSSFE